MTQQRLTLFIATIGLCFTLATPANGGFIYGLKSRAGVATSSTTPTNLYRFEDDGTGFVDLGAITLGGEMIDVDALAISSANSIFGFRVGAGNSTLVSIDASTATATTIGTSLSGRDIRGAAFDSSGLLRVIDAANDSLLRIDPTTGTVVGSEIALTLGGNPFNVSDATDIAQRIDGTYYLVNDDDIYTLDTNSGALALAFSDPGQALPGAAFSQGASSDALFAYEVNSSDDIFRYSVDSAFARTTVFSNIVASFNSGRGDLAAAPTAVPEPSTLFLAAFGALVLMSSRLHTRAVKGGLTNRSSGAAVGRGI